MWIGFLKASYLLPHQEEAIKFSRRLPSSLLYLKPGTGKTLIGLHLGKEQRTAFVVPASLCRNWLSENEKFGVISNLTWWNPAKSKEYPIDSFVCSYEALLKLDISKLKSFKMFVFDECHKLKSEDSQRTKHVYKVISKLKPQTVFLSGTPFTTTVADAYSQYLILDSANPESPLHTEEEFRSLSAFKGNFMFMEGHRQVTTKTGKTVKIPQYSGFQNQTRFFELTDPITFRKELDLNLPELNHQILVVNASRVPKEVDLQLQEMALSLGKDVTHFQTARKLSALAKAKAFADIIQEYHETSGAIVAFSCFPDVLDVVSTAIGSKLKVKILGAKTSQTDRGVITQEFQQGKIDVLLCSLLVAREGFTLTRANTAIFNDISPVASDNEQASKRVHRIGQTRDCRIIYLSRGRIDSRLTVLCTEKKDVITVLDRGF